MRRLNSHHEALDQRYWKGLLACQEQEDPASMEGALRQCPTPHMQEWGCHELLTVTPSAPGELHFILWDLEPPPVRQSGPPHDAHSSTRNRVQGVTRAAPGVAGTRSKVRPGAQGRCLRPGILHSTPRLRGTPRAPDRDSPSFCFTSFSLKTETPQGKVEDYVLASHLNLGVN